MTTIKKGLTPYLCTECMITFMGQSYTISRIAKEAGVGVETSVTASFKVLKLAFLELKVPPTPIPVMSSCSKAATKRDA